MQFAFLSQLEWDLVPFFQETSARAWITLYLSLFDGIKVSAQIRC